MLYIKHIQKINALFWLYLHSDVELPNQRFQPTASLATLASRRLKRGPLGSSSVGYLTQSPQWSWR
jgi:hypothetical protein